MIVTGWLPVFVTVDVCGSVGPSSMSLDPNGNVAGASDSSVMRLVAVPVSVTVTSSALEPTVIVAVFAPVAVGSKRARRSHVSPAVSVVVVVQSAVAPVSRWNWLGSLPPSVIAVSVTDESRCS